MIYCMEAYILINCTLGKESTIISELKQLIEIIEINGVWGKYDIFLKVSTTDPNGVEQVVKRLRNHPDVTDTYTMHVLYGQGGTIDNG
ncbi:AsnC family transcriptional regulator [Nitrosopumilus adriaticus]|uniref:AsnC family transcriptional regulator n=2 Tax=Nitrosopumilus adriaticus TaxID=1580092 RepID=A0A0D5C356_9ARCH|nr:AsnC family transcriptional regulator [Nitrosopumilus adriaticus]